MNPLDINLYEMTIAECSSLLRSKKLSPVILLKNILDRINETEHLIHAFSFVDYEYANQTAQKVEKELSTGLRKSSLHGIPIALKDLFDVSGMPTTAGSKLLESNIPKFDSTVAARLKNAGAIIIGKTITHEFAWGVNHPSTHNPWNLDYYPGGSSVGSSVAV